MKAISNRQLQLVITEISDTLYHTHVSLPTPEAKQDFAGEPLARLLGKWSKMLEEIKENETS